MDRETAKQEVRNSWRQLLPELGIGEAARKVNGEVSYICPLCGHGSGGDGMTYNKKSKDRNSLKCFGCDFSGDIIDLYQKMTGASYNTALSSLAAMIGITVDQQGAASDFAGLAEAGQNTKANRNTSQKTEKPGNQKIQPLTKADYTEYYRKCADRIKTPAAAKYLAGRGISMETAIIYKTGYDPEADPANNPGGAGRSFYPKPRIIMPVTNSYYVGRSIDPDTEPQYRKMNPKDGGTGIFNLAIAYRENTQEVFIVEGIMDALSVIEAGRAAIALNSTSNAGLLIEQLEKKPSRASFIICLDNDGKTGTAAAVDKLKAGFRRLDIEHITADICGRYKDPNEALTGNRAAFEAAVAKAVQRLEPKPDNSGFYLDNLLLADIEKFRADVKTGFSNLDEKSGGLYAGLYCIAAISSLGKTTFAAQIADQIAAAGTDVLFFSLEQSKLELVSKSISRKTAQNDKESAVTSLSIRKGYLPLQVRKAIEDYRQEVGDRISVVEGNFSCNINFIMDYIRGYIRKNHCKPVVFIDYLQILQGDPESKLGIKETVDNSVTELKRLSREQELTIFIISSVNRQNYLAPIDFESLKESGNIEYTCDCIWGLQLQCISTEDIFNSETKKKEKREIINKAKSETPRKIELVSLKNRYGAATYSCYFEYDPRYDLFTPAAGPEEEFSITVNTKPKKAGRKI